MTTNKKTECLGKLLRIILNSQSGQATLIFEAGKATSSDGRYRDVDRLVGQFIDGSLKELLFKRVDGVLTQCGSNSNCMGCPCREGCRDYCLSEIGRR